ncbi:pseudouridine synthase [Amylostereum chailletii]|nr:pseudouridine synthase [Amylostereum chailletii]
MSNHISESVLGKRQDGAETHASPGSPKRAKTDDTTILPASAEEILPLESTVDATATSNKEGKGKRDTVGFAKSRKGKEKDPKTKNRGRRSGPREEQPERKSGGALEGEGGDKAPRLPKRMCAVLIGFCGTGCQGMQIQPDVRTIEGVLFEALVRAGAVSQDNADDPLKVGLGRAARTDAGVHAAGNVVSIKLITEVPGVEDLAAHINQHLPPEIRVWGFVRTQNSFNARLSCDSRKYTYFFPSYLLIPPRPGSGLDKLIHSHSPQSSQGAFPTDAEVHPFWADAPIGSTKEELLRRKRAWRVEADMMEKLRETSKRFVSTHNFHNFTVGRDFGDRSNQRYMMKIEIADPAVYGETEWISVMFHGQSFMLHQRKMMAGLVLSVRTGTPPQIIDELYGPRQVFIPKMPSLGLLLEHPIFDSYNRKVIDTNEKLRPDDPLRRPPIDFEIHSEAIAKFKQVHIYDRMRDIEDRGGVFDSWVRHVDSYAGSDLSWLNPKGTIPPVAVLKKGERRSNPFREKRQFDVTDYSAAGGGKIVIEDVEDEPEEKLNKAQLADMEG